MNLLGKITLICILQYSAADSPALTETTADMSTNWDQLVSIGMKWISQNNNEELFYDVLTGQNNHSLAVLQWINPTADSQAGYNLTVITHGFSGRSMGFQPCVIPVEDDIEFLTPVKVNYLRYDRVLIYFRKQHKTKGAMQIPQVIDINSCKLEESVDTAPYVGFSAVSIVPYKNTFDVVFYNRTLCPEDSWCKITFDHDGKKLSEATPLFKEKQDIFYVDNIYPLSYESGEGPVIVTKKDDIPDKKSVYSPIRGWTRTEDLKERNHFYSNTSGYASVCWQTEDQRNIKCTWLDGTHKDKNGAESIMTIPLNRRIPRIPYTHNTPSGKIALLQQANEFSNRVVFSDTANSDGKCKRYMKTKLSDNYELKRVDLTIVDDNKSCISLVTSDSSRKQDKVYSYLYPYKFETKCVEFSKDFHPEKINCGQDYVSF